MFGVLSYLFPAALFRVTRWREGERGADGDRVVSVSLPLVLLQPVRSAMGGWDSAI